MRAMIDDDMRCADATDLLDRSRRRCADDYGIDASLGGVPARAKPASAAERSAIERLLRVATHELADVAALARSVGYGMVVADKAATIVECRTRDADRACFERFGFGAGRSWAEDPAGTNALGTCAREAVPVSVHRHEHFCTRHAHLSAAAAPVPGPDGELAAILGLVSVRPEVSDGAHRFALGIVARYARLIEERMFREDFRRCSILALFAGDGAQSAALLALAGSDRIVAANARARALFGLSSAGLSCGVAVGELFVTALPSARSRDSSDRPMICEDRGAMRWHALATPPEFVVPPTGLAAYAAHTRPRSVAENSGAGGPPDKSGLSARAQGKVLELIDRRLNAAIRIDDLAATAGLSAHHFARAFKQTVGISPHRYVVRQRVAKAAHLMSSTDLTLASIALEVGFADQSHLSKHFGRVMGLTPNAFRRVRDGG